MNEFGDKEREYFELYKQINKNHLVWLVLRNKVKDSERKIDNTIFDDFKERDN